MRTYREIEMKYLVSLKRSIIGKHKVCDGVGYNADMSRCMCMKVFCYLKELHWSRIPSDYWPLSLMELEVKNLYRKITKDYITYLTNAVENGLGLLLTGEKGIGKTALMCEIGKYAVVARYEVFYELAQNIVDDRFTEGQDILGRLKAADLIIIDELDKIMVKGTNSNVPRQLDSLLKGLLPNKKAIIIGTNFTEDQLEDKFQIMSLLKRYTKIIPMKGSDFSNKRQDSWLSRLKGSDLDFFGKNIVKMAERFHANQSAADEKEFDNLF